MRERERLRAVRDIVAVQRARRSGAEAAFASAREAQRLADEGAETARSLTAQAEQAWREHVEGKAFAPDYGKWLAGRLVESGQAEVQAEAKAQAAELMLERRRSDWQLLSAQLRASERGAVKLTRRLARHREEERTSAMADRVTSDWHRS